MAGAEFASRERGGASSLQVWWPAAVGTARVCRVGSGRAVLRVHECVFLVSARSSSGPWEVCHASHKGAAEALKISCTGAACAAWASVSVWMVGCSCAPSASARIWWMAKTGHSFGAVGVSAVRLCWGMASSCCRPSR